MLGETLSQPLLFLHLILLGFLSGIIFDIFNGFWFLCNKNKVVKHFLDFFATLLVGFVFLWVIYTFNFGDFRAFEPIVFVLCFWAERKSLAKLIEKMFASCYNLFKKFVKKLFKRKKNDKVSS